MNWVGAGVAVLFGAAALSQASVHHWRRTDILDRAERTRRYEVDRTDAARRGTIFAADGVVLAQSEESFELSLDLSRVPRTDAFYLALAEAGGVAASEIAAAAARDEPAVIWRRRLTPPEAKAVQRVKESWRADGVSLARVLRRTYPLGEAAAGVVGEVEDGRAIAGVESGFDRILAGQDGYRKGLIDRTGAFLPMRMNEASTRRVDGQNLTLTLDSELQAAATLRLREAVEANDADSGMAVILDPRTGDVLALANWPSFDPEALGVGAQLNPATRGVYEPGSTFKVLTLAEALEEGKTQLHETVACSGHLTIRGRSKISCALHGGTRAHGVVDAERAIAVSCNVAAATWALRVGYEDMAEFVDRTGVLERPGLGLSQESAGLFNREDPARALQTANVGFGQAISVTPVALASAFGMLANDGVRIPPRLVRAIDGVDQPLRPGRRVVSADTARAVLRVMESVVETDRGTGRTLRIPGYRLAGKTGTAQKLGGGVEGYVSNFVGFVPAREPQAVVLVMIDHPKGGRFYGGEVAGPVFHDLARAIIRVRRIPPDESAPRLDLAPAPPANPSASGAPRGPA